MLTATPLTDDERATLAVCSQRATCPRLRRRALAVLGHARGQTLTQLAALFAVRYATVQGWVAGWRAHGLGALVEGRRAGRPPKLAAAAKKK